MSHYSRFVRVSKPDFGSDALDMQTSFSEKDGFFHLKGKKHWAGLTGMAHLWSLTARRRSLNGDLMRDIDMFICDVVVFPNESTIMRTEVKFRYLTLYLLNGRC